MKPNQFPYLMTKYHQISSYSHQIIQNPSQETHEIHLKGHTNPMTSHERPIERSVALKARSEGEPTAQGQQAQQGQAAPAAGRHAQPEEQRVDNVSLKWTFIAKNLRTILSIYIYICVCVGICI